MQIYRKHRYSIINSIVIIYVKRKDSSIHEVLIDIDDWDWLKEYPIWVQPTSNKKGFYACTSNDNCIKVLLHRAIMNPVSTQVVEHINSNTLDNRKQNLVECTQAENTQNPSMLCNNTSGIRGVSYWVRNEKWIARASINNKRYHLGYYSSKKEAEQIAVEFRRKNMPFSKEAR